MRIGENPNKNILKEIVSESYHRVVLPVYIPNLSDDYFKNSFNVLKICVNSILISLHDKSRLSVVNNGCCKEVLEFLEEKYQSHSKFDQIFNSKINLGKINAVMSVVKSCQEKLITVSDADVLFKVGWQQGVELIFKDIPEAGMVSPVPHSKGFINFGYSNSYYSFFRGKVYFDNLIDPEGLKKFEDSLQRNILSEIHYKKYLVIDNGKRKAVFGCGHFVATYRRETFFRTPNRPSTDYLSTKSDNDYLDLPNEKSGYLRLATLENYAYHLGNYYESWMDDEFHRNLQVSTNFPFFLTDIPIGKPFHRYQIIMGKFINKILFHKFRKEFFNFLGEKNF